MEQHEQSPEEHARLDMYRDVFHHSIYKCSCGMRLWGGPASYHWLVLKHTYERELSLHEKRLQLNEELKTGDLSRKPIHD